MAQIRIPGMPLLPGSLILDVGKDRFPLIQRFHSQNGIKMLSDKVPMSRLNEDGIVIDPADAPPYECPSLYASKSGPRVPAWLVYDRKVLCFHGYFQETLQEVYKAAYQVRKVKIFYYLEDGTMEISEPKVKNSGIPQGCLLSRQRIPKPPPCHNEFITMLDINVNRPIKIYDRIYQITDCDLFTRHFLNRMGIHVPDPIPVPIDPSFEAREMAERKPLVPNTKHFALAQFLENDRKILKFNAYWDDKSEFGDVRNLEVLYYLADDTIEVKERFPLNSGRDAPGTFLKKQKLRKEWTGLPLPGEETGTTLLNVLNRRYLTDTLQTGRKDITYYKDCDLQIGKHMNIFGREVVLTDCDEFTKDYYRNKYGIESFTPLPNPALKPMSCRQPMELKLPPYNGWGDFEDSEMNCKKIMPTKPLLDLQNFIKLDKFILRFGAKMLSDNKDNCERIFIISYYLVDECVQVFELGIRNSGFLGGEFSKKKRQLLPKQEIFSSDRPKYYKPYNFYIGATVTLNDHLFYLATADEFTLNYMEANPYQFPFSDIETIITKVREALRPNYKNFVAQYLPEVVEVTMSSDCCSCFIRSDTFRKALIELLGNHINDHEILTICRAFTFEKKGADLCERELIRSTVHWEIQRNLWNELDRLKEHIYHIEPNDCEYISERKLRSTIMGCRLPFSVDIVDLLIRVLNKNEKGDIEICDFLAFLSSSDCRAVSFSPEPIRSLCPKLPFADRGRLVDWKAFLDKIALEETLKNET